MNSPIALQVKCYLLPDSVKPTTTNIGQVTEIRRFVTTHSWAGIYPELLAKINHSFTGFIKADYNTYWMDEESELVGFTSDEEMKYANDVLVGLQMSQGISNAPHIFKVYIANKKTQQTETPAPAPHHGVVCDGCQSAGFTGIRNKCQVCPDFDLCETCVNKGVHKETGHTFNQIEGQTGRGGWGRGPWGRGGCTRDRKGPHGPHHGGHRGAHPLFGDISSFPGFGMVNNPEELKKFGEHLKSFMEPFGVDVDYFVDNNKPKTEAPKPAEAQPEAAATKMDQEDSLGSQKEATTAPAETLNASAPLFTPFSFTPAAPAASSVPQAAAANENPFVQVMNMMKNFNVAPANANQAEASKLSTSVIDDSFVTVDVEIEKEMKIIKTIEALKLMGYADDGGWLTRLAIAKDGNLNAILDAIAPK